MSFVRNILNQNVNECEISVLKMKKVTVDDIYKLTSQGATVQVMKNPAMKAAANEVRISFLDHPV